MDNEDKDKKGTDSCACCSKPLTRRNKVILGLGKLKNGELICQDCWQAMIDLDASIGVRMNEFTPADVKKKLGYTSTEISEPGIVINKASDTPTGEAPQGSTPS